MNKNLWPLKVLVATVVCFGASSLFAKLGKSPDTKSQFPGSLVEAYGKSNGTLVPVNIQKSVPVESITKLEVKGIGTEVDIEQVDGNEITLSLEGLYPDAENVLQLSVENDQLTVTLKEKKETDDGFFKFNFDGSIKGHLTVKIPAQVQNIETKTVSGDIHISGSSYGTIELKNVAANVNVSAEKIHRFRQRSISGDLKINSQIEQIEIESVSGNFDLHLKNSSPDIELKSTSGDANIYFQEQPNITVYFSSTSGDVSVDKSWKEKETSVSNEKSNQMTFLEGKGHIRVKTISGDLNIKKF